MTQPDHPTTCAICDDEAIGLGMSAKPPHQWVCLPCSFLIEEWKRVKRPSAYKLKARQGGVDAAAVYLESIGKTDLADFEEEEAAILVGRIWDGCGNELRRLIREQEAPF